MNDAAAIYHFTRRLREEPLEHFYALHLDVENKLIGVEHMSQGILDSCLVHPREMYRGAILAPSASVVAVHNHPSGDPEPSLEDMNLTRRLSEAGALIGIPLLDHVIIGERGYVSLSERGVV